MAISQYVASKAVAKAFNGSHIVGHMISTATWL